MVENIFTFMQSRGSRFFFFSVFTNVFLFDKTRIKGKESKLQMRLYSLNILCIIITYLNEISAVCILQFLFTANLPTNIKVNMLERQYVL